MRVGSNFAISIMEIKKTIEKKCYAVKISLEEDGQTAGWVFVYIMFQCRHLEPYAYLENVYVEQNYRSRGIGTQLVKLAIDEARAQGCYKIIGTSKQSKTEVHRWYEKYGFEKMGFEFRMDLIKDSKVLTKD